MMMGMGLCGGDSEMLLRERLDRMVGGPLCRTYKVHELVPIAVRLIDEIDAHLVKLQEEKKAKRELADKQADEVRKRFHDEQAKIRTIYDARKAVLSGVEQYLKGLNPTKALKADRDIVVISVEAEKRRLHDDMDKAETEALARIKREVAAEFAAQVAVVAKPVEEEKKA